MGKFLRKSTPKLVVDELIVKMRFQNQKPYDLQYGCLPYSCISKCVGKSISYCRSICQRYKLQQHEIYSIKIAKTRKMKEDRKKIESSPLKFDKEHYDYLTSKETLQDQVDYSLDERSAYFMKKFPDKKLSRSKLAYIYKKYKIRKKKIGNTKILNDKQRRKIRFQTPETKKALFNYIKWGFRIIYLDEMMVTKLTVPTHAYSQQNDRVIKDYWQYSNKAVAVLAGVSEQIGTDLVVLYDKSVDKQKFKFYLNDLRMKYFFDDICIYMDNLKVHTSNEVIDRMDELGIAYVFSPIYSPDLNPVEYVFSIVKRTIKQERLKAIVQGNEINLKNIVRNAFNIDRLKIAHCIQHTYQLFKNYK